MAAVLPARRAKSTAAAPKAPSLAYSPDMLVNPIEFKDPQFARRATVLDARFWDFYLPKHIAGSINTDCKEWVAAFTSDPSQPRWEKGSRALGIDRNMPVVICDDGVNKEAAAVRAILRYWGFTDVRLLNGGWHACLFAGGPVDGRTPHRTSRPVQLEPAAGLFVTADQVVDLLKAGNVQVVDACATNSSQLSADLRSAATADSGDGGRREAAWLGPASWPGGGRPPSRRQTSISLSEPLEST